MSARLSRAQLERCLSDKDFTLSHMVEQHERDIRNTRDQVFEETMVLVLEALELKDYEFVYDPRIPFRIHSGSSADGRRYFDVDKFEADLRTTLRLRQQREVAKLEAEAEARVRNIGAPITASVDVTLKLSPEDKRLINDVLASVDADQDKPEDNIERGEK